MKRILALAVGVMLALSVILPLCPTAQAADTFYRKAEMLMIKSNIEADAGMSPYVSAQGACTDGEYAYFALPNGATTMLKYDLKNWQLVKKKTGLVLGHANDMTYNSKKNYIAVSHNAPEYNIISIVDPETLKVTESYEIKLKIYSIAYCEKLDCYFVGISGGYNFAKLDSEFNVVKKYKGVKSGYVRQGADCDDQYIYFTQSGGSNIVVVYDLNGKYVDDFALSSDNEVENIFHIGNDFYSTLHYYGSYLHRIGISDKTKITYQVNYEPGEGIGEMRSTTVHYGDDTPLRNNVFLRYGYFFGGWKTSRSSDGKWLGFRKGSTELEWLDESDVDTYKIYADGANVSRTVKFGSITMKPFWISEYYDVNFTSDNAEGYIEPMVVKYAETFTLPENVYTKPGYVFVGYIAERTYDGKHFGYRSKKSKKAEWLYDDELFDDYYYQEGEEVSRMTYDGSVLFTAMFKSAFSFNKSGTALTKYIGIDEDVHIPDREGAVTAILSDAFTDNDIMTELTVPASIDTIDPHALNNCSKLQTLYFEGDFPQNAAGDALANSGTPPVYLLRGDEKIFLGWYFDQYTATFMKTLTKEFEA